MENLLRVIVYLTVLQDIDGACVLQPLLVSQCHGAGVIEGFVDFVFTDIDGISLPRELPPLGIVCLNKRVCKVMAGKYTGKD